MSRHARRDDGSAPEPRRSRHAARDERLSWYEPPSSEPGYGPVGSHGSGPDAVRASDSGRSTRPADEPPTYGPSYGTRAPGPGPNRPGSYGPSPSDPGLSSQPGSYGPSGGAPDSGRGSWYDFGSPEQPNESPGRPGSSAAGFDGTGSHGGPGYAGSAGSSYQPGAYRHPYGTPGAGGVGEATGYRTAASEPASYDTAPTPRQGGRGAFEPDPAIPPVAVPPPPVALPAPYAAPPEPSPPARGGRFTDDDTGRPTYATPPEAPLTGYVTGRSAYPGPPEAKATGYVTGRPGYATPEAPLTDYVTRPPAYPGPPEAKPTGYVTRRPTPPIPSAARSRKPPHKPPRENRAGPLRLRVNPITCDGHGLCAELLPELISRDDWGYPSPVVVEVPPELEGHAQRAAQQCPTLAIVLERRRPRGKDKDGA